MAPGGVSVRLQNLTIDQARVTAPGSPVYRSVQRAAARTRDRAKVNLTRTGRIDTGRLRNSIAYEMMVFQGRTAGGQFASNMVSATIGTDVEYACILGSHTSIVTTEGTKTIGQIKVGDMVMTQSGDFRRVNGTRRFPVTEKPDLVEIRTPWRANRDHVLTVTADHKLLVERAGRFKWIQAGDLVETDLIQIRRKLAHNAGTKPIKVCEQCGASHQGQGRRFCTYACREAFYRDNGHWMTGKERGAEFSARQSEMRKALHAAKPETHPNRNQPRTTNAEMTVGMWLVMRGLSPTPRPYMSGLWPDFFVESERRIYEADGAYWHRDQAKDIARDQRLLDAYPGIEIVHMHFFDERHSPKSLDPNPLPGVWYVAVNPSPESYVEPTVFRGIRPTTLRKYRWEQSGAPHASAVPNLYDLSVEGEHSFLANGMLVSNSYIHDGTANNGTGYIYPRRAKMLRFKPRGAQGFVYARRVRGIKATPFLAEALEQVKVSDFTL